VQSVSSLPLLGLSVLAFLLTSTALLAHPHREPRIAVMSGLLVSLILNAARFLLVPPNGPLPSTAPEARFSTFLLSTLMLVLVALAYRDLRRRSRHPLRSGVLVLIPGLLLVGAMLVIDALLNARLEVLLDEVPLDAVLALCGFCLPPLAFELLLRTGLYSGRPTEPRLFET